MASSIVYGLGNKAVLINGGMTMYPIVGKEVLSPVIKLLEVEAPQVAAKARPGQFIILRKDEVGEQIL